MDGVLHDVPANDAAPLAAVRTILKRTFVNRSLGFLQHYYVRIPSLSLNVHPGGRSQISFERDMADSGENVKCVDLCVDCVVHMLRLPGRVKRVRHLYPITNCEFEAGYYLGFATPRSAQFGVATLLIALAVAGFLTASLWLIVFALILVAVLFVVNNASPLEPGNYVCSHLASQATRRTQQRTERSSTAAGGPAK